MKPLKVGIIGYGRAGKTAVHEILKDSELELMWIARRQWEATPDVTSKKTGLRTLHLEGEDIAVFETSELRDRVLMRQHRVDLLIDLAGSEAIRSYAHLADYGTHFVSAVSHYEPEDLALLKSAALKTAVLHSPNITLGINLLLVVARMLRKLIPHADVQIIEEHFATKEGRSGTAERLASSLGLELDSSILSIRAGGIIGKHELIFGLPNQTIRLIHESINRAAFARGAILAGKWMRDSEPDFYTMEKLVMQRVRKGFLAEMEEEVA